MPNLKSEDIVHANCVRIILQKRMLDPNGSGAARLHIWRYLVGRFSPADDNFSGCRDTIVIPQTDHFPIFSRSAWHVVDASVGVV